MNYYLVSANLKSEIVKAEDEKNAKEIFKKVHKILGRGELTALPVTSTYAFFTGKRILQ